MPTSAVALALCQPPLHHLSASRGSRTPDRVQMPLMCLSCPDPWGSTSSSLKNAKDCGRCQAVDVSQRCPPPRTLPPHTLLGLWGEPAGGAVQSQFDRERQAGTTGWHGDSSVFPSLPVVSAANIATTSCFLGQFFFPSTSVDTGSG